MSHPNSRAVLDAIAPRVTDFLCDLVRIPSTVGHEAPVATYLHEAFAPLADGVGIVPITDEIKSDPDYASPIKDLHYDDRPNVRVTVKGEAAGSPTIINTHMDVVPPSRQHENPFDPQLRDGLVFGRGACDAKGQIATVYALLLAARKLGLQPKDDLDVHFVIEEEVGGNGTTVMVRHQPQGARAIVLEPTDFVILPQVRGAVWFEATFFGQAGHSGKPGGTVSALLKAIRAIELFTEYHDRILAESRGKYPLFDQFENPMPLTIGQLEAGDWPAQAPQTAVFKGVLGILPDRTKEQVMGEMREALRTCGDAWLSEHFELEFTYRHDANVIAPDHSLVQSLEAALRTCGREPKVSAMTASCDAWMYNNQLGIPTVVFGPGSLGVAHSNQEHIAIADILAAAEVLLTLLGFGE